MSSDNKNYEEWSIKRIKKKCIDLEIKEYSEQKKYKKSTLIALLRAYDEEQEVQTPPTPIALTPKITSFLEERSSFILPPAYIEEDEFYSSGDENCSSYIEDISDEELNLAPPSPYEGKTVLVIGVKLGSIAINPDRTLVTKTGCTKEDTIDWKDILKQNVPAGTFRTIIITKPDVFFSQKIPIFTRIASVLSILSEGGDIKLIKYTDEISQRLVKYFNSKNYGTNSSQTIEYKKRKTPFDVFRYGVKIPRGEEFSIPPRKEEVLVDITEVEEYEENSTLRPPGKYTSIQVEFTLIKKSHPEQSNIRGRNITTNPITGINLEEFRKEIDDDDFIESFTSSTKNLLKYKIIFYKKKLLETKKEYERLKRKIDTLMRKGVSPLTIKEMYPMYDFYAGFMVELEEMIETVLLRLENVSQEEIRENLIDAMENPIKGFASIIGREDIKNRLASQLYAFSKSHKTFINAFNNICLLGSAGVGKTATVKVISFVFSKSGILATDNIKIVSRADLVGQYIGQTAPRTRGTLLETLEGVLFIDEAYQLAPEDSCRDFGPEAITEIVNFLDKYVGMNVVIVAGYEDKMMGNFFPSNEGLARRFPYQLILPNYNIHELTDILIRFIERSTEMVIDEETGNYIYSVIGYLEENYSSDGVFYNQAGDMLNLGASIIKSINGSYRVKWKEGNLENNTLILTEGLRDYLRMKGLLCL